MAKLYPYHDLSGFCGETKRLRLGDAKYYADAKRLCATDGRIVMFAPLDAGESDVLVPAASLARSAERGDALSTDPPKLGRKKLTGDGNYPDVFGAMPEQEPEVLLTLGVDVLGKLVDYARRHAYARGEECVGSITLGLQVPQGQAPADRQVNKPLHAWLQVKSDRDEPPVQVSGLVMPVVIKGTGALAREIAAAQETIRGQAGEEPQPQPSANGRQVNGTAKPTRKRKSKGKSRRGKVRDFHESDLEPIKNLAQQRGVDWSQVTDRFKSIKSAEEERHRHECDIREKAWRVVTAHTPKSWGFWRHGFVSRFQKRYDKGGLEAIPNHADIHETIAAEYPEYAGDDGKERLFGLLMSPYNKLDDPDDLYQRALDQLANGEE